MSVRSRTALVLLGLAIVGAQLAAHHSFPTFYFEDETVEIEGVLVEFQYKNPHAWVMVLGQEGLNPPRNYAAEWVGTSRLERDNIDKNTLRAGDRVRVWGAPSRTQNDGKLHLKRILRSDGWEWKQVRREQR
jgi:hypothetical protein